MSYTPRGKASPSPPVPEVPEAAIPATLDPVSQAGKTLDTWDKLTAVLAETHQSIPMLLAQKVECQTALGSAQIDNSGVAEARRNLSEVERKHGEMCAIRASVLARLISQRPHLVTAKLAVDEARSAYAATAIDAFTARYSAAVAALQSLWAESDALSAALRTEVPAPVPARITGYLDPASQGLIGMPTGVPRLERITGVTGDPSTVQIDPQSAVFGSLLDRIDKAQGFIAGVLSLSQAKSPLANVRGFDSSSDAVYEVTRPFTCHLDALAFAAGTLIDAGLVGGVSVMERLCAGKWVRLTGAAPSPASAPPNQPAPAFDSPNIPVVEG